MLCGLIAIICVNVIAGGCGAQVKEAPRPQTNELRPTGEELGLLTRDQFMTAMPDVFLSTSGPISLVDARNAFRGCQNTARGVMAGAQFDDSFASEEITNNEPEKYGISSVVDTMWTASRRYDVVAALRKCRVRFRVVPMAGVSWAVVGAEDYSMWIAASYTGNRVHVLMVASAPRAVVPDAGPMRALVKAWIL